MLQAPASADGSPGAVLRLIREGRASTRAEVMDATGLSRSTVMQRIGLLLSAGLLVERAAAGPSSGGRRPAVLAFDDAGGVVLAADLGARHGRVAICDLAGEPLAEREEPLRIADGPGPVLAWLEATGAALLAEAGRGRDDVLGAAVCVPGPVDAAAGHPVDPPIMPGWDGHPVAEAVGAAFGAPAVLERDVNAMVLGEHRRHFAGTRDLAFVKVATGIGAGVIADGRLVQGLHGRAGDIGHIPALSGSDVVCTCGNRGCVGAVASGSALVRTLAAEGRAVTAVGDVVALVESGDAAATHHVRAAGRQLGAALASLVSVLAPAVLVVGGALAEAPEPLLAGIRESVYQRCPPRATRDLRILPSRLGARAGVVGATSLALDHVLAPASVDALLARRGLAA